MKNTDSSDIDALVERFFAAFDNRNGRTVSAEAMTSLFVDSAVIAKHEGADCVLYTPAEFARPRVALLNGGELLDFHEWETQSTTEIVGGIANRRSRYAKSGLYLGADYSGTGTKFIQFAKRPVGWRMVALSWVDDPV